MNKVILTGRLTSNIELRKTENDNSYTFFTLAVNGYNKDSEATFVNCTAWNKTAEFMEKYLVKGSLIIVEGRLDIYNKQENGVWTSRTTIQVSNLEVGNYNSAKVEVSQEQGEIEYQRNSENTKLMTDVPIFGDFNVDNNRKIEEPEIINANDINLDDIKF